MVAISSWPRVSIGRVEIAVGDAGRGVLQLHEWARNVAPGHQNRGEKNGRNDDRGEGEDADDIAPKLLLQAAPRHDDLQGADILIFKINVLRRRDELRRLEKILVGLPLEFSANPGLNIVYV